jgi:hypothetical protein
MMVMMIMMMDMQQSVRTGRGNRSIRRKTASVPLCQPQIPHDLTRVRTLAATVESRQLTAWAMARSAIWPYTQLTSIQYPRSLLLRHLQFIIRALFREVRGGGNSIQRLAHLLRIHESRLDNGNAERGFSRFLSVPWAEYCAKSVPWKNPPLILSMTFKIQHSPSSPTWSTSVVE